LSYFSFLYAFTKRWPNAHLVKVSQEHFFSNKDELCGRAEPQDEFATLRASPQCKYHVHRAQLKVSSRSDIWVQYSQCRLLCPSSAANISTGLES